MIKKNKETKWRNVEKILHGNLDLHNEDLKLLMGETNVGMSMWLYNIKLSELKKKKILGE